MAKNRKEQEDQEDEDVAETTSDPQEPPEDKSDDEDEDESDEQGDDESEEEGEDQGEEPEAKVDEPDRGRIKLWIVLGVAVVIAAILLMKRESPPEGGQSPLPAAGTTLAADLTLVNADRNDLDCAAEKGVNNYQCGFVDEKTPRQVQESEKLRPFMTIDRHLYLVPGLFLEPAIAERFKSEPPTKPREQLKRFTAKCKVKIAGELDGVKLRWSPSGSWEAPKKFPVANVSECKIEG